jgi:hypothetical protein
LNRNAVTPKTPDTSRGYVSSATQTSARRSVENYAAQEVAAFWETWSPLHSKAETGIAVRRFRAIAPRVDDDILLLALGELAAEGLPAHYFTEKIARERIARIRETLREIEKREYEPGRARRRRGPLRSVAEILAR